MIDFPGKHVGARVLAHLLWRRTRCLFVLSTGRCGTALLTQLLDLSPYVESLHEPRPSPRQFYRDAYERGWDDWKGFSRTFKTLRARDIGVAKVKQRIYAESSNRLTFFAPAIWHVLPQARWLHLFRHPGGVIRSGMRSGWYSDHKFDGYKIVPTPEDPFYSVWSSLDPFAKTCWFWRTVNDYALAFRRTVGESHVLPVSFEDLIDPQSAVVTRIFEFLGIPCPPPDKVSQVRSTVVNHKTHGSFPRFEDWTEQQHQTLHAIAGTTMAELGYASRHLSNAS